MKLRNKKTGEIREDSDLGKMLSRYDIQSFDSISELCKEWEDYKPEKPLINGKKFIDLFKHWAMVNELIENPNEKIKNQFVYRKHEDMLFYCSGFSQINSYGIGFNKYSALEDLEDGELYSYYDLVGEE